MKKFFALLLTLCMVLSMVGVTAFADVDDCNFVDPDVSMLDTADLPHYKIAFSYYSFADKLGTQFKEMIEYVGKAFNVEVVCFESGLGDEGITNIESVLAAGDIQGVIYVGGSQALVDVCHKYGVPFITACGFPSSETDVLGCASYEEFLGGVVDDDEWAGYEAIQALYDAGCRQISWSGLTLGLLRSHDLRSAAVPKFIEANPDMKLVAETYGMEHAEVINQIVPGHPELDGMAFGAVTDGHYNLFEANDIADGSVKLSGIDISSMTGEYFENGVQVFTCGGQYPTVAVAFTILYNYLHDGVRIIEDTTEPITRKYIAMRNYDDFENYVEYIESEVPAYTAEELSHFMLVFNPDVTIEDYIADGNSYSLERVMEARS